MKDYTAITTKYLRQHRKRTILTICGIVVAITMFTAVALIYYSILNGTIERIKKDSGDFEVGFVNLSKSKAELLKLNAEIEYGCVVNKLEVLQIMDEILADKERSLAIKAYDQDAFTKVFKPQLVQGRLPQNSKELIVDIRFWHILKGKTQSQTITGKAEQDGVEIERVYNIVGAYTTREIISGMTYPAITYLDDYADQGNQYSYFATLKDKKHKIDIAEQVARDTGTEIIFNKELLYMYRQGPDKDRNDALEVMIITIISIIILATIVVIYNAFNTSIIERIKHFGILRAIGATKGQIRNLVLREALIMSLIAVPIGVLGGHIGLYVTFKIIKGFSEWFKLGIYPQVIGIGTLLGIGTVLLAVLIPAISASRIAPIEAIRGNSMIKREKVKKRRGILAKLLFSFEGQVAYRNMRRNGKRFWLTTFSLVISLVIFIFFNNFIDMTLKSLGMVYENAEIEGCFQAEGRGRTETLGIDFINELQVLKGVSKVYAFNAYVGPLLIDKDKLNTAYYNDFLDKLKSKTVPYKDMYICEMGQLMGYDENAFNYTRQKNNLSMTYSDLENNNVILINKSESYNTEGKTILGNLTKYKIGDEIKIPIISKAYLETGEVKHIQEAIDKQDYLTFKIAGIIEKEDLLDESPKAFGIIVSNENFGKIIGAAGYNSVGLKYDSKEDSETLYEKLSNLGSENGAKFFDIYKYMKQNKDIMLQAMTLSYGFIVLITLIAIINIIHTITINLLVKKREFAVFKAIGMTKEQFQKLVLLEGTLYGIFASIIGSAVSYLLVNMLLKKSNPVAAYGIEYPTWPYVAGTLGIIGITFIAALLPLRKLNDMNIIDGLRIEE
ncbi:MAG: ABC-type transport system, involved in lipoprotein release, permease component [Clostridia bacterium]|jgi:putative ABC transport system permease protein|nr:ABC-type transport system, involved in lipoprotein release, permease component [Clostridia bacterium]